MMSAEEHATVLMLLKWCETPEHADPTFVRALAELACDVVEAARAAKKARESEHAG